ncbi:MAG: HAD family hydrolase [Gammaproteobacteria bacterium]
MPRFATHTAVMFDMDGLMIDSEPLYRTASARAAAELGYDIDDTLYLSLLGRNQVDSQAMLMQALGAAFPLEQFNERWTRYWYELVEQEGVAIKPGLLALLDALESHEVPFGVATSSNVRQTEHVLGVADLRDRFEVIVTGDRIARGKPAPDIYLEAAARLGHEPRRCIALEDSDAGVLAATAAGAVTFMVPDLKSPGPEAVAAAQAVVDSLDEAWLRMADLLGVPV